MNIGNFVNPISIKCGIPCADNVYGIDINKQFIKTKANMNEIDTSRYNIVPPNCYAANFMHIGRDKIIPVALNNTMNNLIVSPAYFIFEVDKAIVLPEYFYMMMSSSEFDRYAWFCTDSSVRGNLDWDIFCEIEIDLPPILIQQKYVDVYNALLANQQAYENSLENLNIAIAANIEEFKLTAPRVPVGKLLEEIDVRNNDGTISNVQGININKEFMPSVANLSETDLTKYKVVEMNQFAYSAMQTGRDECIRIALFHEDEPVIISPAYSVLQVKDKSAIAEYIMLWFSRSESDRYGWFISDSSIRASLELDRFFEIEIPLPSIQQQKAVVNFYNARNLIQRNIAALGNMLKDICPILVKGAVGEAYG